MKIAVIIPCCNEQPTIGAVVERFHATLPEADIYVYDNNSRDRSIETARTAGSIVRREPLQGKGNVVRRMFADVEADIYVMIDGDDTYDVSSTVSMINKLIDENLDMVVGNRLEGDVAGAFPAGHQFGNRMLTGVVAHMFGNGFGDMLSGFRVFSRRFVKSFPALSMGFEIETELTVHALALRIPVGEVPVPYTSRPPGSFSKLNTYRDGLRILAMILLLLKEEKPMAFFSAIAALFAVLGAVLFSPVLVTYLDTGLVPRFPTEILAVGLGVLACLSLMSGVVLDGVTRGRREGNRLVYLSLPGVGGVGGNTVPRSRNRFY